MRDHDIVPADRVPPAQLHQAFAEAFADYLIGPFTAPLSAWPQLLERHGVALPLSRVALRSGAPTAFALVAPRAQTQRWRLAIMGALPSARGSGAAPWLLDDFVARAATAGQRGLELECFAQNERALRLYASRGFTEVQPLFGYTRAASTPLPGASGKGAPVELQDAFDWIEAQADADLPLQVTPASLRALPAPLHASRHGLAQVVYATQEPGQVTLYSLVDRSPAQEDGAALVAGVVQAHAGCSFHVPQLQRPDAGGRALEQLGFTRLPLHQLYLRRDGLSSLP